MGMVVGRHIVGRNPIKVVNQYNLAFHVLPNGNHPVSIVAQLYSKCCDGMIRTVFLYKSRSSE